MQAGFGYDNQEERILLPEIANIPLPFSILLNPKPKKY